jgi:peptidoglycan/LPS O-acetylase OafA/YrhL
MLEEVPGRQALSSLPRRLPSLDGWRAVSIILVLGAHCWRSVGYPSSLNPIFQFFDGDFGVRCFFVISGFLITWLLVQEQERDGSVSLKRFYIRRALRILPVYFAFMVALWLLHLFTTFNQTPRTWLANLTFTTNFFDATWQSGHLWSLSVEEQFYLIWPALFVALAVLKKPATTLKWLAVPLVIAPFWRLVTYKEFYPANLKILFAHFSFFNYFDCLAIGCMCAVALRHYRPLFETWLVKRVIFVACIGLVLILLPYFLAHLHVPGRVIAASTASLQALGFALLLLLSVLPENQKLFSPLNWRWVGHIGMLSYSIYIWQQLFCANPETYGGTRSWWNTFPGWLLAALIVAHLSYYLLERPLFQLRSRYR